MMYKGEKEFKVYLLKGYKIRNKMICIFVRLEEYSLQIEKLVYSESLSNTLVRVRLW